MEHGGVSNLSLQQTVCSSRTGVRTSKNVWNHRDGMAANFFYFRSNTNLTHHSLVKILKIDMLYDISLSQLGSSYIYYVYDNYRYLWKFQLNSHSFTCYDAPQKLATMRHKIHLLWSSDTIRKRKIGLRIGDRLTMGCRRW